MKIKKNIIYVVLFSMFIAFYYSGLIGSNLQDFQEALMFRTTSGIPIYLNSIQIWTYNIVSLLFDSIIVAIAVGILGYFIKNLKLYVALLYGVLIKYSLAMLLLIWIFGSSREINFVAEFKQAANLQMYLLFGLQLLATLFFSYLGFEIGKDSSSLHKKDE